MLRPKCAICKKPITRKRNMRMRKDTLKMMGYEVPKNISRNALVHRKCRWKVLREYGKRRKIRSS